MLIITSLFLSPFVYYWKKKQFSIFLAIQKLRNYKPWDCLKLPNGCIILGATQGDVWDELCLTCISSK